MVTLVLLANVTDSNVATPPLFTWVVCAPPITVPSTMLMKSGKPLAVTVNVAAAVVFGPAPFVLFSLPPQQHGQVEGPALIVTNLTSFLAFGNFQAPVKGLDQFPRDEWPPVPLTFLSFHNMVILGNLMMLVAIIGAVQLYRGKLETSRFALRLLLWSIPIVLLGLPAPAAA